MKQSTKDKASGQMKEALGSAKAAAGRATKDRELEREGEADKAEGRTQKKVGEVEQVFNN